jgi:hypothetical protein
MLSDNHFIEQVKQIFTNLHPKHVVQCVGGDALKWTCDVNHEWNLNKGLYLYLTMLGGHKKDG